jgi:hypothetical protein
MHDALWVGAVLAAAGAVASMILISKRYGTSAEVEEDALPAGVVPEPA